MIIAFIIREMAKAASFDEILAIMIVSRLMFRFALCRWLGDRCDHAPSEELVAHVLVLTARQVEGA
jgi:hypothetical protein